MGLGEIASRVRQDLAKRADSHGLFQPRFDLLSAIERADAGRVFFKEVDFYTQNYQKTEKDR
jgi:hypothetical protein